MLSEDRMLRVQFFESVENRFIDISSASNGDTAVVH